MKLKTFLSMLIYYQFNFRILHWKVCGYKFDCYHQLAADYYDRLSDDMDTIAEMILAKEDGEIVNLEQAFEVMKNDEKTYKILKGEEKFDDEKFCQELEIMFTDICDAIKSLLESDEVSGNPGDKSELESMYGYYHKELKYKNKRRKCDD